MHKHKTHPKTFKWYSTAIMGFRKKFERSFKRFDEELKKWERDIKKTKKHK